jgi:hypothetical protein
VCKALNGLLPHDFAHLFIPYYQVHSHYTGLCDDLHDLGHQMQLRSSNTDQGVEICNAIDTVLRNSQTFSLFKKHFKHALICQSV